MRNGQNKRMRGRNRKSHNPLTRVYESNGPDVKIRGTASHVADKYVQLARDAQASGDPVGAENYYQHAEHYFRMIAAAQEQFRQSQPFYRPEGGGGGEIRSDDSFDESDDGHPNPAQGEPHVPQRDFRDQPQPYQPREQHPQHHQPHQHQQYQPGQQQPREHQGPRQQPQQGAGSGDVGGLPSFITGAPQQQSHQGYGPNGYDNQADRFPLHRRRRRHHNRGPRPDMPGGQQSFGSDEPDDMGPSDSQPSDPQSSGPQSTNE
jgi:hypothetical protein